MKIVRLTVDVPAGMVDLVDLVGNIAYVMPNGTAEHFEHKMDSYVRSVEELPGELIARELRNCNIEKVKSLLLIRRGGYGDLAFLSCCVAAIKANHPDMIIDVASNLRFHCMFKHNPHIRNILPSSYVPANQLLEYDAWAYVEETVEISRFTTVSAPQLFADRLNLGTVNPVPEVYANMDLVKEAAARKDPNKRRILVQLKGSALPRQWPVGYILEMIAPMAALPDTEVFILGRSLDDMTRVDKQLEESIKPLRNVYWAIDTFSMEQVIALIATADVVVGSDSCFIHIAGGLRTLIDPTTEEICRENSGCPGAYPGGGNWQHTPVRSVGIYGPFPPELRASYYPLCKTIQAEPRMACMPCFQHAHHPCVQNNGEKAWFSKCLRAVTPDSVFDLVQQHLSEKYPDWISAVEFKEASESWDSRVAHIKRAMEMFQSIPSGVSPYVNDYKIQVGTIFGSGNKDMLMKQVVSLVNSGTFIKVNPMGAPIEDPPVLNPKVRLTILDNAGKLKLPELTMPQTAEAIPITVLHSEKNYMPPIPYNDLLLYWLEAAPDSDWFVISDDDNVDFKPAWLQRCITHAERLGLDVWGVEFASFGEKFKNLGSQLGFGSGIIGISKKALHKYVGLFNEKDYLFHGMDSDYIARTWLSGLRPGVVPNSYVATHLGHQASRTKGISSQLAVLISNKEHYRRWRGPKAPTKAFFWHDELKHNRKFLQSDTMQDVLIERVPSPEKEPVDLSHVSVIIPTYEPDARLATAVKSIPAGVGEIIVVDDASPNGRVDKLLEFASDVTILKNDKNMQFTGTVNRGIKMADPDNDVFIFNDDAELIGDCLEQLATTARVEDAGIVSSLHLDPITGLDTALHPDTAPDYKIIGSGRYAPMRWCGFCSTYIKREVLDDIGLLDEEQYPIYSSDTDFCLRAAEAGFRLIYDTEAAVLHWGGMATAHYRNLNPKRFQELAERRIKCTPHKGGHVCQCKAKLEVV